MPRSFALASPFRIGCPFLIQTASFLLLASCAPNLQNQPNKGAAIKTPEPAKPSPGSSGGNFQLADDWRIVSKECDAATLDIGQAESFKFDRSQMTHFQIDSESDTQLCRYGFVYNRQIHVFSNDDSVYKEQSIARSAQLNHICNKKVNGHVMDPPVAATSGKFGPEQFNMTLLATGSTLIVTFATSTECPTGTLKYTLEKEQ